MNLTATLAALEVRGNKRRASGMALLQRAVGAVVGGVLGNWAKDEPRASFRQSEPASFTGAIVGQRSFVAAMAGLVASGMIGKAGSIQFVSTDWGDRLSFDGRAARYCPTARLLSLAAEHGMTPATLPSDFRQEHSPTAPRVPVLVERTALRRSRQGRPEVYRDCPPHLAARYTDIAADVGEANEFAAGFMVAGCLPPRWKRVFTETFGLHGRWYAAGAEGVYQRLSKSDRRDITINGAAVSEIDIQASHLAILLATFGQPMPEGDPYEVGGFDRQTVKAWITSTLGKGSPVRSWAASVEASIRTNDAGTVGAAVMARYPFLETPWERFQAMPEIATRSRLLTHCLMGLESSALSAAMASLRGQGVLALPMHDGLIVPRSAEGVATEAMRVAFRRITGASVRLTVDRPGGGSG
jgi:hypothetical protein